jgi:outer membrane protein OmpA-like peptidoglycan-associated protein
MKLLLTTFLIFLTFSLFAQFEYQKLVDNKKYSKALKKTQKEFDKNSNSINALYSFSILYNIEDSKFFNTDTAYFYGIRTKDEFNHAEQKDIEKLFKQGFDESSIDKQLNAICGTSFQIAKKENTIALYDHFLETYTYNASLVIEATKCRNSVAFTTAESSNSIQAYQYFIDTYPKAAEVKRAKTKRNEIAFTDANKVNSITSYQSFIDNYPEALEVKQAKLLRDRLAFEDAKKINTSSAMSNFLSSYPNSEIAEEVIYEYDKLNFNEGFLPNSPSYVLNFLKANLNSSYRSTIVDSLYSIGFRNKDYYSMRYLAENARELGLDNSIWLDFFHVYTKSGASELIDEFKTEYGYNFSSTLFITRDYLAALGTELIDEKKITLRNQDVLDYFRDYPATYMSFQLSQKILEPYLKTGNWTKSVAIIDQIQNELNYNNSFLNELETTLKNGDDNISKMKLSSTINSRNGNEYVPVISADNKSLYFCGRDRDDNYYNEDIFVSKNVNGNWQKPTLVNDLNTIENDAPLSVSADGNTLLLFKNGSLYYSEREYSGWSELTEFPYPINSGTWEADAMITSDGNSIIFASKRIPDHPYLYDIDIYVSHRLESGWSTPVNLGSSINTEFTDRSPFLHPDMKTLYFSSRGHGGLGELDVFKTTRLSDSSWTDWSPPINLGREFNTSGSDWGYRISTDGKTAYFAATTSNDNQDIYSVNLPGYLRPGFVATIEGALLDKNNQPIEATIKWEDLETGKIIGESKSNPEDGSYFIVLPMGKIYGYYIENGDYYPISSHIDLRDQDNAVVIDKDIEIVTFDQMISEGISLPMNNLFFDTGKWSLLSESRPELKRIANIIKTHNLKVEISGHTDDVGPDDTNQTLSENRANAVSNFLISLGVSSELLTTIGYGESQPSQSNESEEGRALNRRVELMFVE